MSLHTLFETQVKIGISDADFQKGIAAAGTAVKDFASMGTQAIGKFSKSLVDGVSDLAAYGDHIDKQSQKMHMSAQAYQEWDAIMQHSGTSIDSMTMAMKTLVNAADSENEAFEKLGFSMEDVHKMSGEELFKSTITALQNVEDETKRTAIANDLLGRGATELGALLNTSAEDTEKMRQRVHELGGVMSDDAVKASAAFQDSLQDMKTAMGGLKRNLLSDFLPSFTQVMDGVTMIFAGEEGGENKFEQGLANITTTLSRSIDKIKPVISRLGETVFRQIERNIPHIAKRLSRIAGKIVVNVVKDLPDILSTAGDVLYNVGSELGSQILGVLPDWLSDDIKSIFSSVSDLIGNIDFDKLKDSLSGLGDSLEPLAEKLSGGIAWAFENVLKPFGEWVMNDALPLAMEVIGGVLDNISNTLDILAPLGEAAWNGFFKPLFSGIGELSEGTLMMLSHALSDIAKTFEGFDTQGFIDDAINGNFFENWKIGIDDIVQSIDDFGEKVDDFFSVNGIADTWNRAWQIAGGVIYDASVVICDAFSNIVEANEKLIKSITSFPSKWVDFWSGFGEYLATDKAERNLIDSNADGGYVSTPRLSWVAEKEPEYIIPESKMDKVFGRGGNTYNITINMDGSGSTEEQAHRLAELSIEQIRAIGGTGY